MATFGAVHPEESPSEPGRGVTLSNSDRTTGSRLKLDLPLARVLPPALHLAVTLVWLIVALYMVFLYAPQEQSMGEVQRIFYFHVPCAWTAFVGYFLIFLGGLVYLWRRNLFWDDLAVAAGEVGFVFCTCVLVTGPLWAKPVWGIWWTWDARLTATFVLWLLFAAYMMLRSYVVNPGQASTLGAVVGILGFVDVIIDYMAIRWWRTQHPQPVIGGGEGSGLDPRMWATLLVSWGALLCLFFFLVRMRMGLSRLRHGLGWLRREQASS